MATGLEQQLADFRKAKRSRDIEEAFRQTAAGSTGALSGDPRQAAAMYQSLQRPDPGASKMALLDKWQEFRKEANSALLEGRKVNYDLLREVMESAQTLAREKAQSSRKTADVRNAQRIQQAAEVMKDYVRVIDPDGGRKIENISRQTRERDASLRISPARGGGDDLGMGGLGLDGEPSTEQTISQAFPLFKEEDARNLQLTTLAGFTDPVDMASGVDAYARAHGVTPDEAIVELVELQSPGEGEVGPPNGTVGEEALLDAQTMYQEGKVKIDTVKERAEAVLGGPPQGGAGAPSGDDMARMMDSLIGQGDGGFQRLLQESMTPVGASAVDTGGVPTDPLERQIQAEIAAADAPSTVKQMKEDIKNSDEFLGWAKDKGFDTSSPVARQQAFLLAQRESRKSVKQDRQEARGVKKAAMAADRASAKPQDVVPQYPSLPQDLRSRKRREGLQKMLTPPTDDLPENPEEI